MSQSAQFSPGQDQGCVQASPGLICSHSYFQDVATEISESLVGSFLIVGSIFVSCTLQDFPKFYCFQCLFWGEGLLSFFPPFWSVHVCRRTVQEQKWVPSTGQALWSLPIALVNSSVVSLAPQHCQTLCGFSATNQRGFCLTSHFPSWPRRSKSAKEKNSMENSEVFLSPGLHPIESWLSHQWKTFILLT
jgi:hypothetical protein